MITRPTVLILGAGASKAFGLPLGVELRNYIIEGLTPKDRGAAPGELAKILQTLEFDDTLIKGFRKEFNDSNLDSIDDFLRQKREYGHVARVSIAWCISKHENAQRLDSNHSGKWYHFLWQRLAQANRLFDNSLCILTYNYDRAFEEFLFRSYQNSSPSTHTGQDIANEVMALPIIHLHGSLGPLPWQNADINFPFGHQPSGVLEYKVMADNYVRLAHDRPSDLATSVVDAKLYLERAATIGFLGFAYHETHLPLLDIPNVAPKASIVGTAWGLGQGKMGQVKQLIGVDAKLSNVKCLELLKDTSLLY